MLPAGVWAGPFHDNLGRDAAIEDGPMPDYSEFMKPHPDKESIDANLDYALQLDSLLNHH